MKKMNPIYKVWAAGTTLTACAVLTAVVALSALVVLFACTDQPEPQLPAVETSGAVPMTFTALQPGTDNTSAAEAPATRIAYDDKLDVSENAVAVTWEKEDKIRVFTLKEDGSVNQGSQGEYMNMDETSFTVGSKTAKFTGNVTPGANGKVYALAGYINRFNSPSTSGTNPSISFSLSASTLNCTEPMKHLSGQDLLYAVADEGGTLSFNRATTLLRFKLKLPQGTNKAMTKIRLVATENVFYNSLNLTLTQDGWTPEGAYPKNELYVLLQNDLADDAEVIAHMMIAPIPSGFSSKDLKVLLMDADGTVYKATLNTGGLDKLEANKCYTIAQEMTKLPTDASINVNAGTAGSLTGDALNTALANANADADGLRTLKLTGTLNDTDLTGTFSGAGTLGAWLKSKLPTVSHLDLSGVTGLTTIGKNAFYYCEALTKVTLPTSITEIGEAAFKLCGMTDFIIPAHVMKIGDYAFYSDRRVEHVVFEHTCGASTDATAASGVLQLGSSVFHTTYSGVVLLLPNITNEAMTMDYRIALGHNDTTAGNIRYPEAWYNWKSDAPAYDNATEAEKMDTRNYSKYIASSTNN